MTPRDEPPMRAAHRLARALGCNIVPTTIDRVPLVEGWGGFALPSSPRLDAPTLRAWRDRELADLSRGVERMAWGLLPGSGRVVVLGGDSEEWTQRLMERQPTPLVVRSPTPGRAHLYYREISAASDALWVGLPLGALLLCLVVAAGSLVPSSIGGPAAPSPEAAAVGLSAALAALPLAALVGWSCGRAIRRSRYIGAEVAAAALGLVALVVLPAVGLAFGCAAWGLAPALPLAGLCAMVGAWLAKLAERGIERVLEVVEEAEACR